MSLYSITPRRKESDEAGFPALRSLGRDIDGIFDSFFRGLPAASAFTREEGFLAPRLDIAETAKEYQLTLEMPGVEEKDVDVSVHGDVLTIRGEKKAEEKKEGKNYLRVERSYGTFQRSFSLPDGVNADKTEARFRNGVLSVSIPKAEAKQPEVKKIAVKTE